MTKNKFRISFLILISFFFLGFNKNEMFIHFLSLLKPEITLKIPNIKNESALGAALLMKNYL